MIRDGWTARPIWPMVRESRESVYPGSLGPEVLHYSIPALDESGGPQRVDSTEIRSQKLRVYGGEILVGRLNPRKSRVTRVGASKLPIVASTEFVPLIPHDVDGSFLYYALLSETTRQILDSQVRSATRSHQRVDPEVITHLRIDVPPAAVQRTNRRLSG